MKTYKIYTSYKKILADLYTPVALYNKLRDRYATTLLLESADYHDRSDSKSFICLEELAGFEATQKTYSYALPGENKVTEQVERGKDIYNALRDFASAFEPTENALPFKVQGLWGYSSFESVEYMEDIELDTLRSELKDNPDLKYQLFKYVLVLDHFKNELYITANSFGPEDALEEGIEELQRMIGINDLPNFSFRSVGKEQSPMTDDEYMNIVKQGIHHCKVGDTFQVVLSRSFQQSFKGDEFNVYRCLRSINPSPYLFYFDYGDFKIFGSSPESQLQVFDGKASINPIAGTVLRSGDDDQDAQLAKELKANPKEISEHVMLVDLARNDLSKNSHTVEVERYAEIQYFSHVIHMVSNVVGQLNDDVDGLDIYADTFPAGTLSGAPKYKALQIIAENEKNSRNFYGGAIGFLGFDGSVNHAIIIRSVLSKNNTLTFQAGAGVVSESTPEGELKEVDNKVAAIRKAIIKSDEL